MNLNKKIILIFFVVIVILACFGFGSGVFAATYEDSGTLVSKNLLYGEVVDSIDYFGYDVTIPANTTLKVQFSQKSNVSWYSSAGVEDAWDTLSDGDHLATGDAIDLSALNWSGGYFYYKISLETTDTSQTPVVNEIRVHWTEGSLSYTYSSSGNLVSKNLLDGIETVNAINGFSYTASSIPSGTTLKIQFSQDNSSWYNSSGVADGWDTCLEGSYLINLSALGWTGSNFYYKMEFISDGTGTPVLEEISIDYTAPPSMLIKGNIQFDGNMKIE